MELKQYIENFLKSWNIINYGVDYCIECEKASYEEILEEIIYRFTGKSAKERCK